jgi:hypothetical protein
MQITIFYNSSQHLLNSNDGNTQTNSVFYAQDTVYEVLYATQLILQPIHRTTKLEVASENCLSIF